MENRYNSSFHHAGPSRANRDLQFAATPPKKRRQNYSPDGVDRYNYVEDRDNRDIYSNSTVTRRSGHQPPQKKKKGGAGKRIFWTFFVILLVLVGLGALYFHVMASRLNRSNSARIASTRAKYIEQPSAAPAWDVESDGNVINILLLGVDKNVDGSDGRSDTNILASIDQKSKTIRLVSFLRDSYLEIPTFGMNKLNAAYVKGGVALTMQTLENNYRVNIERYMSVDFKKFAAVIDKMGGLDVPMSAAACSEINSRSGSKLKAGTNHLNGEECLWYTRIRDTTDSFGHDDYGRTARQRQVIQLIISKMKSLNPVESSKILYDYLPLIETNLTDPEIACLAGVAADLKDYKIESKQMPAPNTFDDQKSIKGIGRVITLDLKKNCTILRNFLYGDSSSSVAKSN